MNGCFFQGNYPMYSNCHQVASWFSSTDVAILRAQLWSLLLASCTLGSGSSDISFSEGEPMLSGYITLILTPQLFFFHLPYQHWGGPWQRSFDVTCLSHSTTLLFCVSFLIAILLWSCTCNTKHTPIALDPSRPHCPWSSHLSPSKPLTQAARPWVHVYPHIGSLHFHTKYPN